jgi:hypothetical protein
MCDIAEILAMQFLNKTWLLYKVTGGYLQEFAAAIEQFSRRS